MTDLNYPMVVTVLTPEDGGGYMAYAPDLHGCIGDGETPEAAIKDLKDAIKEWVDEARRLNRDVPKPGQSSDYARRERKEVVKLVKAQQNVIKEQDKALKAARANYKKLSETLEVLVRNRTEDLCVFQFNPGVPAAPPAHVIHKMRHVS